MTGVGQTAAAVAKKRAEDSGCQYMELTAHGGARPEHARWQGQLVQIQGKRTRKIIDGLKVFTFGGAYSIDKMSRAEGISWFPEEIPSREEYEEGWKNLEKEDFQVDYILTHTAPRDVAAAMGYGELSDDEVELRQYLQRVADETEFQKWYFGHFHEDAEVEEVFVCLYDEIVELS